MVDDALKADRIKLKAMARGKRTYQVPTPRNRRKKTWQQRLKRWWEDF